MDIGHEVRAARRRRGWTQTQLAKESRLTQGTISKLERDKGGSTRALAAVCSALRLHLSPKV
jgi:transcriptional regulator with XRE-family HTH domain